MVQHKKTTNGIGDKPQKNYSALKFLSAMADSKKVIDKTWLKTTPWAWVPAVCEKTFSIYFVPQPVNTDKNTTYSNIIGIKTFQPLIFTWYCKVVVSHECSVLHVGHRLTSSICLTRQLLQTNKIKCKTKYLRIDQNMLLTSILVWTILRNIGTE